MPVDAAAPHPGPLAAADARLLADSLTSLVEHPGQHVDLFLERVETVELLPPGTRESFRLRRDQGLAVRRIENGASSLASADGISGQTFAVSCDRVAGRTGSLGGAPPHLRLAGWPPLALAEVLQAERRLRQAVNRRRVGFPMKITVRRHRRQVQVVLPRMPPAGEREEYWSLRVAMPWGAWGGLLPSLLDDDLDPVAGCLVDRLRARHLPEHPGRPDVIVLGPHAAAVMLHEVVAHALEADTLALTGPPDGFIGLELGSRELDVIDDPRSAPGRSNRANDDEGTTAIARWLLRRGRVRQPLADLAWAERHEGLIPGAGRRANRHRLPGPRTTHLELLPSERPESELFAEARGGLYIGEFERGALDPLGGSCTLKAPCARRIGATGPVDFTGPFEVRAPTRDLLTAVTAVGDRPLAAGAGWCAKDGALLPVWARCPSIRLEGVGASD